MKLFNKVAAIAVGVMLATGVGAGVVLGTKNAAKADAAAGDTTTVSLDFHSSFYGMSNTQGNQTLTGAGATYGFEFVKGTGTGAKASAASVSSTSYVLFGKTGVYFRNTSAPENSYISAIGWTYTNGVSANVQLSLSYGSSALSAPSESPDTSFGKASADGVVSLSPSNTDNAYFLIYVSNNYNCQWVSFSVTWTEKESGSAKTATETTISAAGDKTTLDVTASPADTVQLTATVTYNSGADTISNPIITWSSDNTASATVSNNGLVTAVSKGVANITATYAGDDTYAGSTKSLSISVENPNEVTFDAKTDTGTSSISKKDITITSSNGALNNGSEYRFYKNSTLTFARASGKIGSIEFTGVSGSDYALSGFTVTSGGGNLTVNGTNGIWEGGASSVTFTASGNQVRATKIVVGYLTGADATLDKDTLTLTAGGASSTVAVSSTSNITNPSYQWTNYNGDDCITLTNATSATVTVVPKSKFAACTLRVTINGTNLAEAITRDVSVNVVRASTSGSPFDINEAKRAVDYNDSTYTDEAFIAGIVSEVDSYDSTHKSITYWISDDGTTANQFEVYSGKGISGADFNSLSDVQVGAEVVVKGQIKMHNSDYEFNYNNELVSYTAPAQETFKVTYSAPDKDSGNVPADHNSYLDNAEVTVLGNTGNLSRNGYVFAGWSDGTTTYAAGETFNIHSNVILTAVWSEVIGTNITMAAGTNGSTCTVNGNDGIKVGTSSKGGDMTITVPAGTTKIKLYAAAWKGVTDLSLDITGATVNPSSLALTNDTGIANSSPFTLSGNTADFEFVLELSNISAETTITLTSSAAKRFVVWGATDLLAETFASDFLTKLVCNSEGTSQPTYTNSYSWSKFNTFYSSLDSDEKAKLHDATANQSGTDIQKAMAKYDYIVGKYNKGQGIAAYNDFIGRNPAKIGASRTLNMFNGETGTAAAMVVVVVSAVSVTALGGFFLLKKKPF